MKSKTNEKWDPQEWGLKNYICWIPAHLVNTDQPVHWMKQRSEGSYWRELGIYPHKNKSIQWEEIKLTGRELTL